MPVIEEDEGKLAAFRRLPALARIAFLMVPVLLIGGGLWAVLGLMSAPAPTVAAKPLPELTVGEARLVNPMEIAVEGETLNVPDGATVTGQLIVDEEIANWVDQEASTGEVRQGRFKMRLRRIQDWNDQFMATSVYSVELTIAGDPPAIATQGLIVPAALADSFYATTEVAVAPTPEPTTPPPPPATPTPQAGPPSLVVGAQATMLISPTLGTAIIGTPAQGATYQPLMRTPDSQFFLVQEGDVVGWLPAGQVTIEQAQAERIPVTTPAVAADAGPLTASVGNGGNIRYRPSVQTGTVLGQMHAHQTVTLKQRTADGQWFHVVAPAAEGWVSVSLLTIDPQVAASVPVAQ